MAAVDVLEALAVESDIRALFRKTASGSSPGRELAERCLASGVVAADHHTVTCDRDALSTIFTAALQHGLGSFIVDYVEEVCADEYLTSNDPREAELLDGRLAKEWCGETLQRIQGQQLPGLLQQAAISASESVQQSVCGLISHVNSVKNVLDALNSPAVREGNQRVVVTSELELARQLQQALLVLQWLQQTGLLPASAGRHVSEREWAAAVRAREAGAKARLSGGQTFLADLLAQLQGSCRCSAIAYPPPSPVAFVQQVLLAGGSDEECWSSKLRLLVYYCSDGGFRTRDGDAVDAAFGLLPKAHDTLVPEARALYALDAALVADADGRDALHSACGLLPGAAHPGLPPKVLEVLVALDRSLDAATVADAWLDACKVAGVSVSRDQARMVLGSVLAAGLLSHAFLMMRRLGEGLAEADRAEGEAQLVQQLAEWARQHQRTHQLLELPFSESEELHLRRWLQQQAAHAPGSAGPSWPAASHQLLSFFLLRSRLTEALLADGGRSAGGDSAAGPAKQDYLSRMRQELLRGVRRQVPEAVRALCAERAGSAVMRTDAPSIQPSRSCSLLDCMDMRLASDLQLAPGPLLHSRLLWPPGVRRSAPSQPPQQLPSAHKLPAPASNAAAPPPQQPPPTRRSANPQPSLDPLPSPALFPPPREQSVAPPVAASPGDGSRGRMYPPLSSIGSMSSAAVGEDAARAPAPPGQPVDSNSPSVTVDTDRPPAAEASIDEILGTARPPSGRQPSGKSRRPRGKRARF